TRTEGEAPDRYASHDGQQHDAQKPRRASPPAPPDGLPDFRTRASGLQLGQDPIDPDGLPDVLDDVLAERLVRERELVLDLVVDGPGDRDAPRLGEAFDARRHGHAVTVDPFALHDHVAEVDADAKQ